jgi:hypothetical protein
MFIKIVLKMFVLFKITENRVHVEALDAVIAISQIKLKLLPVLGAELVAVPHVLDVVGVVFSELL